MVPGPRPVEEVSVGALLVIPVIVVVIGLVVGLRRAEERTFTFAEPVHRAEVDLRAGGVSLRGL
jgi:hypothetical protein